MPSPPRVSLQTLLALAAFAAAPRDWRYGLSLAEETGLKSGTLYPLLIRLAAQGFLEAKWNEPDRPGRPPRHAYRLTREGLALAKERMAGSRSALKPAPGKA
jgi:PadR family transcriptional regulator, regulatory protein PadR